MHPVGRPISKAIDSVLNKATTCRTMEGLVNHLAATSLLNEFTTLDSNIEALTDFTGTVLDGVEVKLQKLSSGGAKGQSGASIFLTQGESGASVAVIKIFPQPEELIRELSSLERLRSNEFTHFTVPDPLAAAVMNNGSNIAGILVSEVAQGQSIADLIAAVGSSKTMTERATTRATLQLAVVDTARALAELHTLPVGSGGLVSDSYISFHISLAQHLISIVAKTPRIYEEVGHLDIDELRRRLDDLIPACRVDINNSALVHRDAHPGNFFWHSSAGVTLIDTPTFHYSMDSDGAPIAAPERDISNFVQRLAHFCWQANMNENEIWVLRRAFMDAYRDHGGAALNESKLQMFGVRSVLNKLVEIGERMRQPCLKSLKKEYKDACSDLKTTIVLLKGALNWID